MEEAAERVLLIVEDDAAFARTLGRSFERRGYEVMLASSLEGMTELLQQRDVSYNESIALSKEGEEALLFRNMQTDLVQQLMRRLAIVKMIPVT